MSTQDDFLNLLDQEKQPTKLDENDEQHKLRAALANAHDIIVRAFKSRGWEFDPHGCEVSPDNIWLNVYGPDGMTVTINMNIDP